MNKQFKVNHQTGVSWNVQPVRCSNFNDLECVDVLDKRKCLSYQDGNCRCPYFQDRIDINLNNKPNLRPGQPCDHPGEDCPEGNM